MELATCSCDRSWWFSPTTQHLKFLRQELPDLALTSRIKINQKCKFRAERWRSWPCQLLVMLAGSRSRPLSVAFPTSAKTSQELKSQLCLSTIPARCNLWYNYYYKDRMASHEFPNHYSFLQGVLTFLVGARPCCESSRKHALNLFGRFIELVYQTAARFFPMYIAKNTRHPPHRQHFWGFFPNLGEGLSWRPTRWPPVIFKAPRGVWRWE